MSRPPNRAPVARPEVSAGCVPRRPNPRGEPRWCTGSPPPGDRAIVCVVAKRQRGFTSANPRAFPESLARTAPRKTLGAQKRVSKIGSDIWMIRCADRYRTIGHEHSEVSVGFVGGRRVTVAVLRGASELDEQGPRAASGTRAKHAHSAHCPGKGTTRSACFHAIIPVGSIPGHTG